MRVRLASLTLAATAAVLLSGVAAPAQGILDPGPVGSTQAVERPEYAGRLGKMTPTEIIQQKAQVKAAQRAGRIAVREWYGYSQARPTTAATPFAGMYGAQFNGYTMGRPDSHYATRPILVFSR